MLFFIEGRRFAGGTDRNDAMARFFSGVYLIRRLFGNGIPFGMNPMVPDVRHPDRRKGPVTDMKGNGYNRHPFFLEFVEKTHRKMKPRGRRSDSPFFSRINGLVSRSIFFIIAALNVRG